MRGFGARYYLREMERHNKCRCFGAASLCSMQRDYLSVNRRRNRCLAEAVSEDCGSEVAERGRCCQQTSLPYLFDE